MSGTIVRYGKVFQAARETPREITVCDRKQIAISYETVLAGRTPPEGTRVSDTTRWAIQYRHNPYPCYPWEHSIYPDYIPCLTQTGIRRHGPSNND